MMFLLKNGHKRVDIDNTLFIKKSGSDVILTQVYINGIIFGSTNEDFSKESVDVISKKFEISMMGELTFFVGLQVR